MKCEDLGTVCSAKQDPDASEDIQVVVGGKVEQGKRAQRGRPKKVRAFYSNIKEAPISSFMTKSITRKEAMSDDKFYASELTWREMSDKAIKREMNKFEVKYGVFGDWAELDEVLHLPAHRALVDVQALHHVSS